ncbi:helix-turn-helix transcriptional regulator [Salinarimonas soli]|uniref:DNA-binding protein n=1 Tax=Salinarimonas soli TaxID=1638099 RepID=A0A5B2VFI5_9HYPH|nr:DNA-binding protein [Salinarimonas soli]KAA2236947.1 DNA-binding protein [Salinarimonas soli]
MDTNEQMLSSRKVRDRYGVTDMSLWRWLRDEKLQFPQPMVINRRRYWRLSDLVAWERNRDARKAA